MRLLRDTSPARAACILTLLTSAGVLLGWQLGLPRLRAVLAGHVAMNPTTAVTFMLAAGSLWCLTGERSARRAVWWARVTASLVALVGLVTIAGYLVGENLGVDQLLFGARLDGNRIAPNTGVNFLMLGIALLLLDWRSQSRIWPAQLVLLVPIIISTTSLLGYGYGVGALYGIARYIPMALPTAAGPYGELEHSELAAQVERAIDAIHPSRRPVVRMHLLGHSRDEIARLLGWSEAKTRNLLYRGLADLRERLLAEGVQWTSRTS